MPVTKIQTITTVEFSHAEAEALVVAHLPALSPVGAVFDGKTLKFDLPQDLLQQSLAEAIPNLPASFSVMQVRHSPDVALRVTWTT